MKSEIGTTRTGFIASALLSFTLLAVSSCANRPCRDLRQPQRDTTGAAQSASSAGASSAPAPVATPPTLRTAATGASTGGPVSATQSPSGSVFVFKADGSLQCGMGKAISAEEMEKELKGIKVLSREKRSDGMMHIQVCGSPTGMINIYEIPAGQLSEAEGRGFKKLERP